ncbi:MAG TPA: DUF2279 domain-containing protein [Bacteroidia bacterium]|nr:DUF2279 domain-containing protein [Bacteroidia bacterium]HRS58297.1 DUF2279 domain-containing protein [Bacteroidia bacterium]
MRINKLSLFFLFLFLLENLTLFSQIKDSNTVNRKRLLLVGGGSVAVYSVSLTGLNQLWYAGYDRSPFHFFNDNREWLQFDKVGHFTTAYYESLLGIHALKWTGLSDRKSIIFGSLYGIIFQTPIEILDGFSAKWGASAGDLTANTLGSALVFSQYMLWNEQKILVKYSFHPTPYADLRPSELGENLIQQLLKDYNGATIWLSASLNDFYHGKKILPDWLALSIGYGAEEMVSGRPEDAPPSLSYLSRYRQFYLALDVNTWKIKTDKKFLKLLLGCVSVIKFPAPALEFNRHGVRFHPLYF